MPKTYEQIKAGQNTLFANIGAFQQLTDDSTIGEVRELLAALHRTTREPKVLTLWAPGGFCVQNEECHGKGKPQLITGHVTGNKRI